LPFYIPKPEEFTAISPRWKLKLLQVLLNLRARVPRASVLRQPKEAEASSTRAATAWRNYSDVQLDVHTILTQAPGFRRDGVDYALFTAPHVIDYDYLVELERSITRMLGDSPIKLDVYQSRIKTSKREGGTSVLLVLSIRPKLPKNADFSAVVAYNENIAYYDEAMRLAYGSTNSYKQQVSLVKDLVAKLAKLKAKHKPIKYAPDLIVSTFDEERKARDRREGSTQFSIPVPMDDIEASQAKLDRLWSNLSQSHSYGTTRARRFKVLFGQDVMVSWINRETFGVVVGDGFAPGVFRKSETPGQGALVALGNQPFWDWVYVQAANEFAKQSGLQPQAYATIVQWVGAQIGREGVGLTLVQKGVLLDMTLKALWQLSFQSYGIYPGTNTQLIDSRRINPNENFPRFGLVESADPPGPNGGTPIYHFVTSQAMQAVWGDPRIPVVYVPGVNPVTKKRDPRIADPDTPLFTAVASLGIKPGDVLVRHRTSLRTYMTIKSDDAERYSGLLTIVASASPSEVLLTPAGANASRPPAKQVGAIPDVDWITIDLIREVIRSELTILNYLASESAKVVSNWRENRDKVKADAIRIRNEELKAAQQAAAQQAAPQQQYQQPPVMSIV
jgi:hypothetical protein